MGRREGLKGGAADKHGLAKIGGGPKIVGGKGIEGGKNRIDVVVHLSLLAVGAIGFGPFRLIRSKCREDLIKFRAILLPLSNHPAESIHLIKQFEQ